MAILEAASAVELRQLMELFPISNLRAKWPDVEGPKEDICEKVAAERDIEIITAFIRDNLGCCKQHIYFFFGDDETLALPTELPESVVLDSEPGVYSIFLAKKKFDVILTDTMERKSLTFVWPFKVQILQGCLIVQFVMLEKNLRSHLQDKYVVEFKGIEEDQILQGLRPLGVFPADIHKGIKKLWDDGFMDCPRLKYVDPDSTTETVMKESRGIKEFNPTLYEKVRVLEFVSAVFALKKGGEAASVHGFSVEPSNGYVAIHRYSDRKGDTDLVISEILKRNQ